MYTAPYAAGPYDGEGVSLTQAYFTPPTVRDVTNYLHDSSGLQVKLWRHFRLKERGVNVFALSDGTFVQDTATPENGNTGYPLPWILNSPNNEFSTVYNINGTVTHTTLDPFIIKVYEGGHRHLITASEATRLTRAGYTVEYA